MQEEVIIREECIAADIDREGVIFTLRSLFCNISGAQPNKFEVSQVDEVELGGPDLIPVPQHPGSVLQVLRY